MNKKSKYAIVVWEDACTHTNTNLESVLKEPPDLVTTFGVITKTDKYMVVMTHEGGESSSDFVRIPSTWVKKITYVYRKEK